MNFEAVLAGLPDAVIAVDADQRIVFWNSAAEVLTERWTRVAPNMMHYEAVVNDPKTWTAPFKISMPLEADPQYQLFEYACHEGNYSMFGMLQGARADEAAAKQQ